MKRLVSTFFCVFLSISCCFGASSKALIPKLEAQRYGLTRAWYNQLKIDTSKYRVTHVLLQDRMLYITTDNGCIHIVDGENGATRWMEMLGEVESRPLSPAANSRMVAVLAGTTLYVFDQQTGKTLWELPVSGTPVDGVVMSERYVFVPMTNGRVQAWPIEVIEDESTRYRGFKIEESPDENPLTDKHDRIRAEIQAAVDSVKRDIQAGSIKPTKKPELMIQPPPFIPLECQSFGGLSFAPVLTLQTATSDHLVWPSNRGELYFARIGRGEQDRFLLQYQIRIAPQSYAFSSYRVIQGEWKQPREVSSRPTYRPGMILKRQNDYYQYLMMVVPEDTLDSNLRDETKGAILTLTNPKGISPEEFEAEHPDEKVLPNMVVAGTVAGVVTSIDGGAGRVNWKYTASRPIVEQVAAIRDRVYFCLQDGGMYCLDSETGQELWFSHGLIQFIAESNHYVYGKNRLNEMVILDRSTGQKKAFFSILPYERCLFNIESDRIYLITADGLIQCLHERDLVEPLQYRPTSHEIVELLFETGGFRDATKPDERRDRTGDLFAPSMLDPPKTSGIMGSEGEEEDDVNPFLEPGNNSRGQDGDDLEVDDLFGSGEDDDPF